MIKSDPNIDILGGGGGGGGGGGLMSNENHTTINWFFVSVGTGIMKC